MKTKLFALLVLATGFVALGASAQVPDNSAPQANQMVYSPRLPSAAELTSAAAAQGLTIDKIVQTTSQVTVVYRTASGQTNTVAYMLLPSSGNASASAAPVANVATPSSPAPQVVYAPAPASQVVYYAAAPAYYDPYYYPAYYSPWYAPVALSVGFGFGYHGGYYHGGGWGGGWHGHH